MRSPSSSIRSNRLNRARAYLVAHHAERVRVSELAAVAGLSSFHFVRMFRRQFGLPPHAYQIHIRVEEAKTLLVSGLPLVEVALATGFADHSHFTRIFCRIIGVPPSRYQKLRQV